MNYDTPETQLHPDWDSRLPGEQWLVLDSAATAEAYLAGYDSQKAQVVRMDFPNPEGLYAKIRYADRITEDRIYIGG
jgi:hypothetical protein